MKSIGLHEGLSLLEEGIQKAKGLLDGKMISQLVTGEEYMKYYSCVYYMCHQHPKSYSEELYDRFKEAVEDSINSKILPCLAGKKEEDLMIEVSSMWDKYKNLARTLSAFFAPLDKIWYRASDEPLYELAIRRFRTVIVMECLEQLLNAAVSLINRARNGEAVDTALLKNISTFFMEIGGKKETDFKNQFEQALLVTATRHYSQLASQWLLYDTSTGYLLKAEQCLLEEKERVSQTLYQSLEDKLLKEVYRELITETRKPLMEKREAEKFDNTTYQELIRKCDQLSIW